MPESTGLREQIARALREHQPPTHVDPHGLPGDEFDCCVDAVMGVIGGIHEGWAVAHTDLWGEPEHVEYASEEIARGALVTHPRGAVLQRRWQSDWATVYPERGKEPRP